MPLHLHHHFFSQCKYTKLMHYGFLPPHRRHRLEIWADGFVSDEDPEKFCGNGVGKWPYFLSTGQQMLVRFVSAGPHSGERFNFLLSFITGIHCMQNRINKKYCTQATTVVLYVQMLLYYMLYYIVLCCTICCMLCVCYIYVVLCCTI